MSFTRKTFKYFDTALEHRHDEGWFQANRSFYEDVVKAPMTELVESLDKALGHKFKKIKFSSRSIANPRVPVNRRRENGSVKDFTKLHFCQKRSSVFEWNPGIYIHFGSKEQETFFAGGLYMVSSRQMKEYREKVYHDYQSLDRLLRRKSFKDSWGTIQGETYKRFPRDFDQNHPSSKHLWRKQLYFSKTPTRTQMIRKDFIPQITEDFKASADLLNWIIETVGVYRK